MCVHTAISQCGHTCTLGASSRVSGRRVGTAMDELHPPCFGPFPSISCWRGPPAPLRSLDEVGQRCDEQQVSRLEPFSVGERGSWL